MHVPLCSEAYFDALRFNRITAESAATATLSTIVQSYFDLGGRFEAIARSRDEARRAMLSTVKATQLPASLLHDVRCLQIDSYLNGVLMTASAGHRERSIAMLQAFVELNISTAVADIVRSREEMRSSGGRRPPRSSFVDINDIANLSKEDLFCRFWTSEFPRIGDALSYATSSGGHMGGSRSSITAAASTSPPGLVGWVSHGAPPPEEVVGCAQTLTSPDDGLTVLRLFSAALNSSSLPDGSLSMAAAGAEAGSCVIIPGTHGHDTAYVEEDVERGEGRGLDEPPEHLEEEDSFILNNLLRLSEEQMNATRKRPLSYDDDDDDDIASPQHDIGERVIGATNGDTASSSSATTNAPLNEEDGYRMVYSRVHGYKIRVKIDDDSGSTYKKILSDMHFLVRIFMCALLEVPVHTYHLFVQIVTAGRRRRCDFGC